MKRKKTFLIIIYILMLFSVFKPGNVWAVAGSVGSRTETSTVEEQEAKYDFSGKCFYYNAKNADEAELSVDFTGNLTKQTITNSNIKVTRWKSADTSGSTSEYSDATAVMYRKPGTTGHDYHLRDFNYIAKKNYVVVGGSGRTFNPINICPRNAVIQLNKDKTTFTVYFFQSTGLGGNNDPDESDYYNFQQYVNYDTNHKKGDGGTNKFIPTDNVSEILGVALDKQKSLENYQGLDEDIAKEAAEEIKKEKAAEEALKTGTTYIDQYNRSLKCSDIIGSVSDEKSVAWYLQKILNYIKVIGALIIIVLSGLDFTQAIISSDQEKMKKAQNKLMIRIVAMIGLFLLPNLIQLIIGLFFGSGITDITCGLS